MRPLHERIRRDFEARILSGALRPGDRIPVEHRIMADYGCSRMTVSKALGALVQAGLIERRRRAGSFVARPRFDRAALEIPDIRAEVERRGGRYGLELISRAVREATPADRERMPAARRLLALECRHLSDAASYALERRLINLAAVPEAEDVDFSIEPPGSWLLVNVPWTEAEHRITACSADTAIAARLALSPGAACLSLERWTRRGETPITYARQLFAGDSYGLLARFTAG